MSYDHYPRGPGPQRGAANYPPKPPESEEYPADFEPEDHQSRLAPPQQRGPPPPMAYGQQYAPARHPMPQYPQGQYQQQYPQAYPETDSPTRGARVNTNPQQMPFVSPPHSQRPPPVSSEVDQDLLSGLANLGVGFVGNVQRPNTPSAPMQGGPHPQELGDRRGFRPAPIAASARPEDYQGGPQYQGYAPENGGLLARRVSAGDRTPTREALAAREGHSPSVKLRPRSPVNRSSTGTPVADRPEGAPPAPGLRTPLMGRRELYGSGSPGQSSRASSAVRAAPGGLRQGPPPQQIRQPGYDPAYGADPYAPPAGGPMISPGPAVNQKFSSRATMQHFAPDVPQQPMDPAYARQDPYASPSRNIFARGAGSAASRKLPIPDDGGGPPTVPALSINAPPPMLAAVDTGTPGSGRGKHRGKLLTNLNTNNTEDFQKSWDISKGGAFIAGGYEIGNEGISRSPVIKEEAVRTSIAGGHSAHTSPRGGVGDIQPSPTSSASSGAASPDPRPSSGSTDKFSPNTLLELSSLGKGAGGFVMKALHIPTFQLVALKSVDVFDKNKRHQLIKELHAFESTHHPNVVSYYGAYFSEGSATMVLEFMDRGSLQQVIDKHGPLNEDSIRHIARQCLEGLHCIHSMKQIHRDIKPGNILLNHLGQAKISDFGIAGQLQHTDQWAQTFVGTAIYMSPERIQSLQYTFSADIWSLGMTFITCATGRFPFETGNYWGLIKHISQGEPPKVPDSFSPAFQDFVARCLVKDPALRWPAAKLMQHPFLNPTYPTADAQLNYQWPFEAALSKKGLTQTVHMLHTILQKLYVEAGESFRNSPFDQARFSRLAAQTGLDVRYMLQLVQQTYQDLISHPQAPPPPNEEEEEAQLQEPRGSTAVAGVGGPAPIYVQQQPQLQQTAPPDVPAPVLRLPGKKGRMALPAATQAAYDEPPDSSITFEN